MSELTTWLTFAGVALLLVGAVLPYAYRRAKARRYPTRSFVFSQAQVQVHHTYEVLQSDYGRGTVIATCWEDAPWEVEFVVRTEDRVLNLSMHRDDLRTAANRGIWGNDWLHVQLVQPFGYPHALVKSHRARIAFLVMHFAEPGTVGFDFSIPYRQVCRMVKFWDKNQPDYTAKMRQELDVVVDELSTERTSGSDSDIER